MFGGHPHDNYGRSAQEEEEVVDEKYDNANVNDNEKGDGDSDDDHSDKHDNDNDDQM